MIWEELVVEVALQVRTRNTKYNTSLGIAPSTHLLEVAAPCLITGMNLTEKRKSSRTKSETKAQMKTKKERMRIKFKTNNRGAV